MSSQVRDWWSWHALCAVIAFGFTGCFPAPHIQDVRKGDGEQDIADTTETLDATANATATGNAEPESETSGTELPLTEAAEISDVDPVCRVDEDCDNRRACDGIERCDSGACVQGEPISCDPPANACQTSTCDELTGACVVGDATPETECDDADGCTTASHCEAGECIGAGAVECPPPNECQEIGTCDRTTGTCAYPAKADALPCRTSAGDDGTCRSGLCARLPILVGGARHVCAVLFDGSMHCWGANEEGQLGLGHTQDVGGSAGRPVHGESRLAVNDVKGALAGPTSTCAWGAGWIKCWGANAFGSLGYPDDNARGDSPETVPQSLEPMALGAHVASGAGRALHSCIVTPTGGVRCWGLGQTTCHFGCLNGWLGYPGILAVGGSGQTTPAIAGDVELSSDGTFVADSIAVGMNHSCALSLAGDIRCWGVGRFLGTGSESNLGYAAPPSAGTLTNVGWQARQIAAGIGHSCAVTIDHQLYCWGDPTQPAALGLGTTEPASTPKPVEVGFEVERVALGTDHTCALSRFGTIKCWGRGAEGQLGTGVVSAAGATPETAPASRNPVFVGGTVANMVAGTTYTCALLRTGAIRCWGKGPLGRDDDEVVGNAPDDMPPRDVPIEP